MHLKLTSLLPLKEQTNSSITEHLKVNNIKIQNKPVQTFSYKLGYRLSCTGCCQYSLNMKCLMYGILLLQLSISLGCFHPRTFFLKKRIGLVSIDLFISYLHTLLMIINRSVSGLVTDSPCCVWGRGLTICLLCNGPI